MDKQQVDNALTQRDMRRANIGCALVAVLVITLGALLVRCVADDEPARPKKGPVELCAGLKRGDIVELRYTTHLHATEGNAMMHMMVQHMGTDEDVRTWVTTLLELEKAGKAMRVEEGTQLEVLRAHEHETEADFMRYTVEIAGNRGVWWITGAPLKRPEDTRDDTCSRG